MFNNLSVGLFYSDSKVLLILHVKPLSSCCHNWRLKFLFVQSHNPVESNWSFSPLFKMLVVVCLFVSISCKFFSSLFFSLGYLLVDMERFLTTYKVVKVKKCYFD